MFTFVYSELTETMADYREEIERLQLRLVELFRRQEQFSAEISELRSRIDTLRNLINTQEAAPAAIEEKQPTPAVEVVIPAPQIPLEKPAPVQEKPVPQPQATPKPETAAPQPSEQISGTSGLERYIGENLIPVIGTIITVIGVGIGAKYAIDHQLITPLTRILLGYLMGGGLLFFAVRFKPKYHYFSAVLLSGSMAIFYFITFFAYSFYGLIPLPVAFLIMLVITGFTVWSAIRYNLEIVAHIGLIGAYAVPVLLSNNSGRIGIFFSYIAIINVGILVVSFFRNWKSLYYVSLALTWLTFSIWTMNHVVLKIYWNKDILNHKTYSYLALVFLCIYFVIFYATNLAHKLIKKEPFDVIDGMLICLNSFIFYFMGMLVVGNNDGEDKISWFTLINAAIHLAIAGWMYLKRSETNRSLMMLSTGLAITFFTIFIPLQLEGNWITLLWICEGGLLFWFGRTQRARLSEIFSHALILMASISLMIDYVSGSGTPFWNPNLLTSLIFVGVLYFMYRMSKNDRYLGVYQHVEGMQYFTNNLVYVLMLLIAFLSIQLEISGFWMAKYHQSMDFSLNRDYFFEVGDRTLRGMGTVCSLIYALLFLSALAFFKRKKQNTEEFRIIFMILFIICIFVFLTAGLYTLNFMHLKYLSRPENSIYYHGFWLVGIRYVAFGVLALAVFQLSKFLRTQMPSRGMTIVSEYILHTVIVWCGSAELVNWVHSVNSAQTYKLALSIFAGLYALFLIVLGIWKHKSYLRIGAFSLFGITLLKLFFYDIRHLDTIFKTVIFISLGILLLIIAFLYNRFKNRIFE